MNLINAGKQPPGGSPAAHPPSSGRTGALRAVLAKILDHRFGHIPAAVSARVETASEAELERFIDRGLEAKTLADLFIQP